MEEHAEAQRNYEMHLINNLDASIAKRPKEKERNGVDLQAF